MTYLWLTMALKALIDINITWPTERHTARNGILSLQQPTATSDGVSKVKREFWIQSCVYYKDHLF